jgi:hypothetical protein
LMLNHVYITHPDVDSYAREAGNRDASASRQIRQPRRGGNHYILWFAFIAWLGQIFSVAITKTYNSFNIIAVIRLPISHAFSATQHPHPRQNARPLYIRISPDWSRRFV